MGKWPQGATFEQDSKSCCNCNLIQEILRASLEKEAIVTEFDLHIHIVLHFE